MNLTERPFPNLKRDPLKRRCERTEGSVCSMAEFLGHQARVIQVMTVLEGFYDPLVRLRDDVLHILEHADDNRGNVFRETVTGPLHRKALELRRRAATLDKVIKDGGKVDIVDKDLYLGYKEWIIAMAQDVVQRLHDIGGQEASAVPNDIKALRLRQAEIEDMLYELRELERTLLTDADGSRLTIFANLGADPGTEAFHQELRTRLFDVARQSKLWSNQEVAIV